MDQVKTKIFCLGYFCRFMTSALTLRPQNTYIYVFQALLSFRNLLDPMVLEASSRLILFYDKLPVNKLILLGSKCTSLLLSSKPAQRI